MAKRRHKVKLHKPKCVAVFKIGYSTEKAALTAINKHTDPDLTLYHYKCPHCREWHLTRMKQPTKGANNHVSI